MNRKFFDDNMSVINVVIRDNNDKRNSFTFKNKKEFRRHHWSRMNDDENKILFVTYGPCCVYNGLVEKPITFKDLIGIFT